MNKNRLEAFSDGVLAIVITIMVLELHVPAEPTWPALLHELPTLLSYLLSFIYVGIYWNNHHHMLHLADRINGKILWANLHLLFWLSLVPFVTGWMGENHFESLPTAVYGANMLLSGLAYWILERAIIGHQGPQSKLKQAVGGDTKAKISTVLYSSAIPLAFVRPWIATAIYVTVALMWLVPDKRIEAMVNDHAG